MEVTILLMNVYKDKMWIIIVNLGITILILINAILIRLILMIIVGIINMLIVILQIFMMPNPIMSNMNLSIF